MDILNTIVGSEITEMSSMGYLAYILGFGGLILVFMLALSSSNYSSKGEGIAVLFGLICIVIGIIIALSPIKLDEPTGEYNPDRYEVVINDPNYIIDATKYRIIETKGKITVLEEVQ